jgi:hypothetical protein
MRASSIGHLTGVQLPYGIHLIGVRLGQACGSHGTYISQTCVLDRRATLTGHTLTGHTLTGHTLTGHGSHGHSDFGANGQLDTNRPSGPPSFVKEHWAARTIYEMLDFATYVPNQQNEHNNRGSQS